MMAIFFPASSTDGSHAAVCSRGPTEVDRPGMLGIWGLLRMPPALTRISDSVARPESRLVVQVPESSDQRVEMTLVL